MSVIHTQMTKESLEREIASAALEKARKLERKRKHSGWRFVKVNDRTEVFVPCDENGKPTRQGKDIIRKIMSQ